MASLLAACLVVPAAAQAGPGDGRLRLISRAEGEAIVEKAWELRRGLLPKPDCSHFVHAIYTRAGMEYEYAQTADIFAGIDPFQRVKTPQPGDLVVWQGHVGIVVDPVEHSFYSSVITGFAIEDYRSNYWLGRGASRFYRYMVDDARTTRPLAPVLSKQFLPTTDPQLDFTRPDAIHKDSLENLREDSRTDQSPAFTPGDAELRDAEVRDAVFVSRRKKPSKEEVLAAVMRSVDANGQRLLLNPRLDSQPAIALAEQFTVTNVDVKDNSGWADLKVKRTASVLYGKADPHSATDIWRIRLTRQGQDWSLVVPQDRTYIRSGAAFTVLVNHLASMSRATASNQELKKLLKILDQLLNQAGDDTSACGSK